MYILKYKGQGKQGRNGAKNPRSILHSSQAQSLCFWSWFSLFSYFIIMPCRASLSLLFFVQFSPVSQHYNVLIPGRKCLIGVNNTQPRTRSEATEVAWVRAGFMMSVWGTLLYVYCTNHQPTTLGHHAMLRLMSNSEILQTSLDTRKEDKHSLFLKNEMSMKGCFLRTKCL